MKFTNGPRLKSKAGILALSVTLLSAGPVLAQDGDRNGVNVVDQDGEVINGPGVDQSNESNNNRETSQEQSAEVNDSDNRSVTVEQGGGEANAEVPPDALLGPAVAVGTGPVLSPPVAVANNDILSNKSKTTHINQHQSYEDNSEFSDDHSRTVISRSFNHSPGSSVSIGRRRNSDVIILGDKFGSKETVAFQLSPAEKGTLPRTGMPRHAFTMLAAALLAIVFGSYLELSDWRRRNGLIPAMAGGSDLPSWTRCLAGVDLEAISAAINRLSMPRSPDHWLLTASFAGQVPGVSLGVPLSMGSVSGFLGRMTDDSGQFLCAQRLASAPSRAKLWLKERAGNEAVLTRLGIMVISLGVAYLFLVSP